MTLYFRTLILFAVSVVTTLSAAAEEAKLSRLLERTPAPANAMGYVNIGSLNQLMRDAGFSETVSGNVDEYWFLSDLDLMKLRPKWEAGYATLQNPIDAKRLAERVDGYVDDVDGQSFVWSPRQTYFVPKGDKQLGLLRPADRSLLSGWLSAGANVNYSSYLESKAKQPESFLSLMLAIETKNVFSPVPLAKRLETFKSIKSKPPESVASTLASATGLTIIVGRRSLNECIVSIDFAKSPAALQSIAAELLAELLDRAGAAAPEVLTWESKVDGNQLSLQGPITEATLSGLLGIFSLQGQASDAMPESPGSDSLNRSKQEQMAYLSKHYFDEITEIVERTRKHKSQTTGALAKWNDQRARQIDELGTLNVDPAMLKYGSDVAELLRGNSLTITQGNITAGKTKASQSLTNNYYGNGYYGNGYYDANSTADYHRVTAAYASGNAYADYKDALNQIDKLTAMIRKTMTDKYQMQF